MLKANTRFLLLFKEVTETELVLLDKQISMQAPESTVAGFYNVRKGDGIGLVRTAVLTYDSFRKGRFATELGKCGLRKYTVCDSRLIDRSLKNYLKDIEVQGSNTLAEDVIKEYRKVEHYIQGIVKPEADEVQKLRQMYAQKLEES